MLKGLLAVMLFALNALLHFHISQRMHAGDPVHVLTLTLWFALLPLAMAGMLLLATPPRTVIRFTGFLGVILCGFIALALVRANLSLRMPLGHHLASEMQSSALPPVEPLAIMPVSTRLVPTPEDAVRQYRPFLPRMLTASLRMDELAITTGGRLAAYFSVVNKTANELDIAGLLHQTRLLLVGRLCSIIPVKQYVLDHGFAARALVRDRQGTVIIEQQVRREDCEVRTVPPDAMDMGLADGGEELEAAGTN